MLLPSLHSDKLPVNRGFRASYPANPDLALTGITSSLIQPAGHLLQEQRNIGVTDGLQRSGVARAFRSFTTQHPRSPGGPCRKRWCNAYAKRGPDNKRAKPRAARPAGGDGEQPVHHQVDQRRPGSTTRRAGTAPLVEATLPAASILPVRLSRSRAEMAASGDPMTLRDYRKGLDTDKAGA